MAKTKKMGFGGFLGGILSRGASKPIAKALAGGVGALKPAAALAGGAAKNIIKSPGKAVAAGIATATKKPGMPPKPIRDIGTGSMPRPGMGPKPGVIKPRSPIGGVKPTGIGQANFPRGVRGTAGAAGAAAGRALGMGKKKGGMTKGKK